MLDLAAGMEDMPSEVQGHVESCGGCATKLTEMRKTMSLLDEWKTPEPSPYFDVRLQAQLREEMAKPQAGWLQWFRRPAMAAALTLALTAGAGVLYWSSGGRGMGTIEQIADAEPGTAVSDLQSLERNHEIYTDLELLDDLEVQHDVVANP